MRVGDRVVIPPRFKFTKHTESGVIIQRDDYAYGANDPMFLVYLDGDNDTNDTLWVNQSEIICEEIYKSKLYKVLA